MYYLFLLLSPYISALLLGIKVTSLKSLKTLNPKLAKALQPLNLNNFLKQLSIYIYIISIENAFNYQLINTSFRLIRYVVKELFWYN